MKEEYNPREKIAEGIKSKIVSTRQLSNLLDLEGKGELPTIDVVETNEQIEGSLRSVSQGIGTGLLFYIKIFNNQLKITYEGDPFNKEKLRIRDVIRELIELKEKIDSFNGNENKENAALPQMCELISRIEKSFNKPTIEIQERPKILELDQEFPLEQS